MSFIVFVIVKQYHRIHYIEQKFSRLALLLTLKNTDTIIEGWFSFLKSSVTFSSFAFTDVNVN